MSCETKIFGIRHHGPGSARQVRAALEAFSPQEVLIEGPIDLSDQIPSLADAGMIPPVALVAHPAKEPDKAIFWPFSSYAPERQAILWAVENNVPVRFIDLPVAASIAFSEEEAAAREEALEKDLEEESSGEGGSLDDFSFSVRRDPVGALARAAGYGDGESWWSNVIEENPSPGPVFEAISMAMGALRENEKDIGRREAAREAHMRLEIKASEKTCDRVAVVCGAWHVPALEKSVPMAQDKAVLKGMVRKKVQASWAPWSEPRLASAAYGAGVPAPGWCRHVWETEDKNRLDLWLAKLTRALRVSGKLVSTASLIEAHRLASGLAILRGRPQAGLDEVKDAAISVLTDGSEFAYDEAVYDLLMGTGIGVVPEGAGQPPLLEDLSRQQKALRLKPSVKFDDIRLDLRKDLDRARSVFLHRLCALEVTWGRLRTAHGARGTFREDWRLHWSPEMAIALVDKQALGSTIEAASNKFLTERVFSTTKMSVMAQVLATAFMADLPLAADRALDGLSLSASRNDGVEDLLNALPEIASAIQYGNARGVDVPRMRVAFETLVLQAALALPSSVRGLEKDVSILIGQGLERAFEAIILVNGELGEDWEKALKAVAWDRGASSWICGIAARILLSSNIWGSEEAGLFLSRRLSGGVSGLEAALVFEGFFKGHARKLGYDEALRESVSEWLLSLEDEEFIEHLPAIRRGLVELSKAERDDILDVILGRVSSGDGFALPKNWEEYTASLSKILKGDLS